MEDQLDTALLVLRLAFGVGLADHGYNKIFGGGGLAGTAGWFESIGMKWPPLQARLAAATEIGTGLLFAVGLLTPLAAAGMIGVMTVAYWAVHRENGFLVVNGGWEFVAAFAIVAWAVATIGPGRFSLDNAFDIEWTGWSGSLIAALVGVGSGIVQLAVCYRPQPRRGRCVKFWRIADRHRRRRARRLLGVGAVLRVEGGRQQDRRPELGAAGRVDL